MRDNDNAAPAERQSSGAETRTSDAGAAPSAIDYPGVTAGKDEHDRARERGASPEMPPWPPIYRLPSRHFHEDDIEFSVRQDVESALRARDERIASLEESLRIHVKLYTDSHSVEFEQRDQIASLERKLDLAHEAVRGRNDLAEAAQALGELWDGLMAGRQHSYVVRAAIEKIKALEAENARLTSRLSRTEELWLKHTGEMVPIMESREDAWSENERIKAENARLRGDLEQSILDGKGTAKLLAIAERDRNRAEASAAARRDGDCHDACEAPDKCERCGKPATHDTADWVPLCKACYDALSVDPSPAAQDRRETNEQNTAQRDAGERGTPRPQEDGITAITTPSGTVPLSQPDSPAPPATRETDTYPCYRCGKPRTAAEGGKVFTVCDACWGAPSDPSPAAGSARVWSEQQREAARLIASAFLGYDGGPYAAKLVTLTHHDNVCAEIAKHAHLFVQDPKEGERSAMREVRPETSASSEPLGSALSDDEIGSRIMNGLGVEKYDPSDLMPWERRVGKRARALFAKPAPVAVTRERIMTIIRRARHLAMETSPGDVNYSEERVADAVLSALSAPVSAEALERACKQAYLSRPFARSWEHDANRMARMGEARALLKQLGIATEGT